jgi:hypothetical protein
MKSGWTKVTAGMYEWRFAGRRYVVSNHPRVFPRGWRMSVDGKDLGYYKTLQEAQQAAGRGEAVLALREES